MKTTNPDGTIKKKSKKGRKKTFALASMTLPGVIYLLILSYLPMFGIVLAFKKYRVYQPHPTLIASVIHSQWNGLGHFGYLFKTTDSLKYIRNTICYNVVFIAIGLVLSVSLAIMLSEITNKFVAKTYQTLMFFPYFISWVVASYFVAALLDPSNGLITRWQMNTFGAATAWYTDTKPWPVILTVCNAWKNTGYSTVLYLAAITGIDTSLFEAAAIDGATKWQQIKYITIPNLKAMITILLIMDIGRLFCSDFGLFYNIPQGSGLLSSVTTTIDVYVYRTLTGSDIDKYGKSTAGSLFQNIVGFVLLMTANAIIRKIDEENSLF